MPQETILVTGAAGGVGSTGHMANPTLLEGGHRVPRHGAHAGCPGRRAP